MNFRGLGLGVFSRVGLEWMIFLGWARVVEFSCVGLGSVNSLGVGKSG